ncbi:uncharacterized protein LOC144133846 [Amblyomma americanum]
MDKATFNEALITEVERRRVLWDVRDRDYKNNMKRDQAWRAIAVALSVDVTQVMKRWKSLRDTFMKKRKEVTAIKSGAGADSVVNVRWPHFNQLLFLLDTLEYPETRGNLIKTWTCSKQRAQSASRLEDLLSMKLKPLWMLPTSPQLHRKMELDFPAPYQRHHQPAAHHLAHKKGRGAMIRLSKRK